MLLDLLLCAGLLAMAIVRNVSMAVLCRVLPFVDNSVHSQYIIKLAFALGDRVYSAISLRKAKVKKTINLNGSASTTTTSRELPKELALSFSGCGFLGTYHIGVMWCFQKNAPQLLERVTRYAGTSAGCMVAGISALKPSALGVGLQHFLDLADELQKLPLGALSPGYFIAERLGRMIEWYLPREDIKKANGLLYISMTRQKSRTNRLISEYPDREYLLRCLNATCFIPIYSSGYAGSAPVIDGERYVDGGYSNNLPIFDDIPTITISPFSGSALISPTDPDIIDWQLSVGAQNVKVNLENAMRFAHALYPPTSNVLEQYYERGYRDGLKFLMANGFIERDGYEADPPIIRPESMYPNIDVFKIDQ